MQTYLRKGRLSTAADDVGLRAVVALMGLGWFIYLWGLTVPALLAGLALGMMGQLAVTRYRRRTVHTREAALRQRLGGEMMLEEILLAPPKQAHFQTALLLGEHYPLTMERVTADGMLCISQGEHILISCAAIPEHSEVSPGQLTAYQRACRAHGVTRGVVCVTGKCSAKTEAWAEEGPIPLRIIRRETLLKLAGQACPATDEQLVALGQRRKRLAPSGSLWRNIIREDKAKRYLYYGVGLMIMYILTGLRYYPVPGCVCLFLSVLCRIKRHRTDIL